MLQDVLLVQFEPLLDKFGWLLSRASKQDTAARLGFAHARLIVLPFAVAPEVKNQTSSESSSRLPFYVAALDGCSKCVLGFLKR